MIFWHNFNVNKLNFDIHIALETKPSETFHCFNKTKKKLQWLKVCSLGFDEIKQ